MGAHNGIKKELAIRRNVIKLKILIQGDYPGLSEWVLNVNYMCLYKRAAERVYI